MNRFKSGSIALIAALAIAAGGTAVAGCGGDDVNDAVNDAQKNLPDDVQDNINTAQHKANKAIDDADNAIDDAGNKADDAVDDNGKHDANHDNGGN